jgi:hypothetical protein
MPDFGLVGEEYSVLPKRGRWVWIACLVGAIMIVPILAIGLALFR